MSFLSCEIAMPVIQSRRRKYLVDKKIQTGFIIRLLSILAILAIVSISVTYYLLSITIENYIFSSHLSSTSLAELIHDRTALLNTIFFILASIASIGIASLFYYRASNSLKHFVKHILNIEQQPAITSIQVEDDLLFDTRQAFNKAMKSIGEKFSGAVYELEEALSIIAQIKNDKHSDMDRATQISTIKQLKDILLHLKSAELALSDQKRGER